MKKAKNERCGSCENCGHLDKQTKEVIGHRFKFYRYGCAKYGKVVGWVKKESELKEQGCSEWKPKKEIKFEQLMLFD